MRRNNILKDLNGEAYKQIDLVLFTNLLNQENIEQALNGRQYQY